MNPTTLTTLGIQPQEDGTYKCDDHTYDTPWEAAALQIFGFCGCGDPLGTLAFAGQVLRAINAGWESWAERQANFMPLFGEGKTHLEYYVFYHMTELELLEHGWCVPGWLTDKGKAMLDLIDSMPADLLQ